MTSSIRSTPHSAQGPAVDAPELEARNNTMPPNGHERREPPPIPKKMVVSEGPAIEDSDIESGPPTPLETRDASSLSSEDLIIAVMGVTGSGKSTFISKLADQSVEVGHSLTSCTTEVGVYSLQYDDKRTVYLVDTPGFDDTNRSDTDVLKDVAFFLSTVYSNKVRLAGIIYLHRISDPRMGGSALKNLYMFQRLCGDRGLASVILATTMWQALETTEAGREIGLQREQELQKPEFWGSMTERGSKIMKHDGSAESARDIVSRLVERETEVVLDIQVQLVDDQKTLDETSAGQYIQKELLDARKRFERDIADYQESMEAAMQEKDDVMLQALKKEKEAAEAKEKGRQQDWQKLNITVQQLAKEKDKEYKSLADALEKTRKDNSQVDQERESQSRMVEEHLRGLHKALRDGEERHRAELEALKRTQVSQTMSEVQRINYVMQERQRLWEEEKRHLKHRLDRERRIRLDEERWTRNNRLEERCTLM